MTTLKISFEEMSLRILEAMIRSGAAGDSFTVRRAVRSALALRDEIETLSEDGVDEEVI